jgi:hypothetical protein
MTDTLREYETRNTLGVGYLANLLESVRQRSNGGDAIDHVDGPFEGFGPRTAVRRNC